MTSNIVSSHWPLSRPINMVREALVRSVMCTPPSTPPVRFQTSQLSTVPKSASPRSASARSPGTWSSSQRSLGPAK